MTETHTPDSLADTTPAAAAVIAFAPEPMETIQVRLGDLGLAKENLRYNEPADDGVPQLANTIEAAGVVIPPIVARARRPSRSSWRWTAAVAVSP
jgi:hypothetical protein